MAGLTGKTVASSYVKLLTLVDGAITEETQVVEDGLGGPTKLSLSNAGVTSTGTLTVDGISTLTGAVTAPGGVVGDLEGNADTATKAYVTDNESTDEENLISFVADAAVASGNHGLEMDGNLTYNPSSGTLTTTAVVSDLTGDIKTTNSSAVVSTVLNANVGSDDAATFTGVLTDGVTATTQVEGNDSTKVATTAYVEASSALVIPTGAITAYAGVSAPTGWLLCDGAFKDAVTYITLVPLWQVIGDTYGGTGQANFQLPDLRGSVPVGNAASGTFETLGGSGGAEDVTLTGAESGLAAHGHTMYTWDDPHSETPYHGKGNGPVGTKDIEEDNSEYTGDKGVIDAAAAEASEAHTNLQPYLVINYIIKI